MKNSELFKQHAHFHLKRTTSYCAKLLIFARTIAYSLTFLCILVNIRSGKQTGCL